MRKEILLMIGLMAAQAVGVFDGVYEMHAVAVGGGRDPDERIREILDQQRQDLLLSSRFELYPDRSLGIEAARHAARLEEDIATFRSFVPKEPQVQVRALSGEMVPEHDWKESGWVLRREGFASVSYLQPDGTLSRAKPVQPENISTDMEPVTYTMVESNQTLLNASVNILEAGKSPKLSAELHAFNGTRSGTEVEIVFGTGADWTRESLASLLRLSEGNTDTDFGQLFDTITSLLAVESGPNQPRFKVTLGCSSTVHNHTAGLKMSLISPESGPRFELSAPLRADLLYTNSPHADTMLYGFLKELCGLEFRVERDPRPSLVTEATLSADLKEAVAIGLAISAHADTYIEPIMRMPGETFDTLHPYTLSEEMATWMQELRQDDLLKQARAGIYFEVRFDQVFQGVVRQNILQAPIFLRNLPRRD